MDITITEYELELFIDLIKYKISKLENEISEIRIKQLELNQFRRRTINKSMEIDRLSLKLNNLKQKLFEYKSEQLRREVFEID